MSFYRRYELERLVADGEAKTFRAVETATGRPVWLHIFNPEGQELAAALKAKAAGAGGKPVLPVIEIGEFAGSQYAVTEAGDSFPGLRQWVDQLPAAVAAGDAPAPARRPIDANPPALLDDSCGAFVKPPQTITPYPAPRPAAPVPPLVPDEAGEFTRLFERDDAFPKAAPSPPPLVDDASGEFRRAFPAPASEPPAIPAPQEMGDFTRAFGLPALPAPDSAAPRVRVPPPTPRRPAAPELPSVPPDWAVAGDTGEFTKLFGPGLSGEALDIASEQAKAAKAAPSEGVPFQHAGEFTRMFGPPPGAASPAAKPAAPPSSLNTSPSGLFALPADQTKATGDSPENSPLPDAKSASNEYTSVFGQKPAPSEPAAPTEPKKPAPDIDLTAPKSRMRPGVIAGVVIGIAVLILLIVLALR
jgi:hypothetical protein